MSRYLVLGAALIGLIGLSACATETMSGDVPSSQQLGISPEQAAAIADGVASYNEYAEGFRRYTSCMEDAGYSIDVSGETNQVITYSVPTNAVDEGIDERCYSAEFARLDMLWQVARQDTSADAQRLRACLSDRGIEPADTWDDMVMQADENAVDLLQCLAPG